MGQTCYSFRQIVLEDAKPRGAGKHISNSDNWSSTSLLKVMGLPIIIYNFETNTIRLNKSISINSEVCFAIIRIPVFTPDSSSYLA